MKNLLLFISAKKYFLFNLFLAQQWRLTTEGKLENKLRTWAHGKKSSTQIPSYGEQGIINIAEKWGEKKILTFPPRGNIMKYNVKLPEKFKSSQTWKIGHPDDRGWFKISSLKAENRYLTVTKIGRINQLTMEKEGMYSLKCLHLYYSFVKSNCIFKVLCRPLWDIF